MLQLCRKNPRGAILLLKKNDSYTAAENDQTRSAYDFSEKCRHESLLESLRNRERRNQPLIIADFNIVIV